MAWQLDNMVTPSGAGAVGQARPGGGGGRSLQLEDMEHLAAQSTLLEGKKLITPSGHAACPHFHCLGVVWHVHFFMLWLL